MKLSFDELIQQHKKLLECIDIPRVDNEEVEQFLEDVRIFMTTLQAAGAYIGNPRQRDQLRKLLNFWASHIYEHRRIYPNIKLEPFAQTQSTRFNLETLINLPPLLWIFVLGIIVFCIILFFVLIPKAAFIALITNPTLTPTATSTATATTTYTPTPTPSPTSTLTNTVTPTGIQATPQLLESYTSAGSCSIDNRASGEVRYLLPFNGDFRAIVKVNGLEPNHDYAFTINCREGTDTCAQLSEVCNEYEGQGYCDILLGSTDATGVLETEIRQSLPKGEYVVKFFIKDPASGWCIPLHNDEPEPFIVN